MPRHRDPALRGFAPALLLLLALAVLALLLRRRWRLAAARREEVMRLVLLASEESARAELESALAYAPAPGFPSSSSSTSSSLAGGRQQCAVCCSPTTTRCSRCKAVRYCSGKCQILHWRQGHKEECRPPQTNNQNKSQGIVSSPNGIQDEHINICDGSSEIEGKGHGIDLEAISKRSTFSQPNCKDDIMEDNPLADSSETESTSDSFTISSSSCSTFSGTFDISDHAFGRAPPNMVHNVSPKSSSSCDDSSSSPTKVAGVHGAHLTKPAPFELDRIRFSVDSVSLSSSFKQKVSICDGEDVNSVSDAALGSSSIHMNTEPFKDIGKNGEITFNSSVVQTAKNDDSSYPEFSQVFDHNHLNAGSPQKISSRSSGQAIALNTRTRTENSGEGPPAESATLSRPLLDKSTHISTVKSKDSSLLNEGLRCPSSGCASEKITSSGGRSDSSAMSTITDEPIIPTRLSQSACSVSNGTSDLKTYVKRVLQHSKSYKHSRNLPSRFSDASSEHNYKILFPYDLFMKLYNSDKVELCPFGLINCGNSCYANAVLQCLAFTRPLTAYLLGGFHSKTCSKKNWCFTCEFENLLLKAKQGKSPISAIGILSHIDTIGSNLGRGREEDAHEFLRYAIDALQSACCLREAGTDFTGSLAEETTLVHLTFGGYLQSKIKCMRCQSKSERHERIMDLTVEIHGDIGTLEEALERFTATEILDGENKYKCNRCKSYEKAKKKLTILEAPNILTIALKRYQSGKFGKLNKAVRFPEYLDLAPYMSRTDDKSPVYRLYAVVVHLDIMNAAFSGHYVCYVKNSHGKWYRIDDSMVKPVELDNVLSKGAYLLLYARCSPCAPSLIRTAVPYDNKNSKSRGHETLISSIGGVPNSGTSPLFSRNSSSAVYQRKSSYSHKTARDIDSFGPLDSSNDRFFHGKADSSSDSSSLLSFSDEGSWSTESTRDSTSTEELSEYIFGELDTWNSPMRSSKNSDGFAYSPLSSRHSNSCRNGDSTSGSRSSSREDHYWKKGLINDADMTECRRFSDRKTQESREVGLQGRGSPRILYADTTKYSRKLAEQFSGRETDWVNKPNGMKYSVTMRRPSTERTAQTFY